MEVKNNKILFNSKDYYYSFDIYLE